MSQKSTGLRISPREHLRKIRRSHSATLGVAELVGLAIGALMLVAVIVGYLYFQVPAQLRGGALARDRDNLKHKVQSAQLEFKSGVDLQVRVDAINISLERFEDDRLADRDGGRMALYEALNQLIQKNSLRNTSGPAYTPLDTLTLKKQGQAASAKAVNKWQSIYPGLSVNVTVEGQYQNIRHFVRDIESSKEFIIINAVELERATGSNAPVAMEEGAANTGSGNALVSLRMDLATYFSRPTQASEKPATRATTVN